jgi:5-methylcytosine-specific restriction endonuclease McrA
MSKEWNGATSRMWRVRLAATLPQPCPRCRRDVMPGQPFDVDHVTPISRGGTHTADNLRAAHRKCNRAHGQSLSQASMRAKKNPRSDLPNL